MILEDTYAHTANYLGRYLGNQHQQWSEIANRKSQIQEQRISLAIRISLIPDRIPMATSQVQGYFSAVECL